MGVRATTTETSHSARVRIALPAAMIGTGIVSVQFGAGLADRLFAQIPPAAVTGLRDVLQHGTAFPAGNTITLAVWAVVAITFAARMFRWE